MKLIMRTPGVENYAPRIDTDCTDVVIREAFVGPTLETADGERLSICMRDSGFEVCYIVGEPHDVAPDGSYSLAVRRVSFQRGRVGVGGTRVERFDGPVPPPVEGGCE